MERSIQKEERMEEQKKYKIEKNTVQETLIIPLYARKKCTEKFPELYSDRQAVKICEQIDYDFSELDRKYETTAYEFGAMEGALRQMDMMWEINDYLTSHPGASIVCMGCGLDCDPRRCGDEKNKIYNLDFPDVMKIREELVGIDARETNIAGDINDLSWMDRIDAGGGVIFYAAGVVHYFAGEDIRQIVLAMKDKFPGGRFIFDTVGKFGLKMMFRVALKGHDINDVGGSFFLDKPVEELSAWTDGIKVSTRPYMLGYYDMKSPGVRMPHRLLAKIGDKVMKMNINRIEFI